MMNKEVTGGGAGDDATIGVIERETDLNLPRRYRVITKTQTCDGVPERCDGGAVKVMR